MASSPAPTAGRKYNKDYISLLPDCLIHHIFSFLLMRDIVKTCVLSKRWRSVWTTVSDLKFSVTSCNDLFIDRVLALYGPRKVKKFHLHIRSEHLYPCKIESWVRFAVDHQVEELLLNLNWWGEYKLTPLLCNCSSFTVLSLSGGLFLAIESISWSSLKSLSIQHAKVSYDELREIFTGSPVLEYLKLTNCWDVEGIHSRSLKGLVIDDVNMRVPSGTSAPPLEIWTPCLLSLRVRGNFYEMIRILEASSLVEAELDIHVVKLDCSLLNGSLCKLQNATRIQLGAWCLSVMGSPKVEDMQFSLLNCKSLTLDMTIPQFSFPAIANMLETAPTLEKLVIIFYPTRYVSNTSDFDFRIVDHESYWHIMSKSKLWAQHLKNVEIFGFYACLRFKYEEVLVLVKFLLRHAFMLENMVINITPCKLLEVARRIQSFDRASEHVAVILNDLEEGLGRRWDGGVRATTGCLCIERNYADWNRNTASHNIN